jgi:L-ascorbate metabolism protein UlaG (beta-lactamase superfamily)
MENYEQFSTQKMTIKAFPAYNTTSGRDIYHPKNRDNGYIINVGGTHIYFAGDCEDMPEMKTIGVIDIAFLPVNQPYTMTVEQAIRAVEMVNPKILFPYHYGDTDLKGLEILKEKGVQVIIKPM